MWYNLFSLGFYYCGFFCTDYLIIQDLHLHLQFILYMGREQIRIVTAQLQPFKARS